MVDRRRTCRHCSAHIARSDQRCSNDSYCTPIDWGGLFDNPPHGAAPMPRAAPDVHDDYCAPPCSCGEATCFHCQPQPSVPWESIRDAPAADSSGEAAERWPLYEVDTDDVCTLEAFDGIGLMTGDVRDGLRMTRETARVLADRLGC